MKENKNALKNGSPKAYKAVIYIVLSLLAVMIIVPVAWVFIASIKQNSEFYGNPWALPQGIHLANFADAWQKANIDLTALQKAVTSPDKVVISR